MACTINASVTSTGLIHSADATGNLDLQGNGTTGLTVNNSGKVVIANTALSTASAGTLEYDGGELYFTPLGTQRGLVPGMQYYRLDSSLAGSNVNTAQSILGVGVTLSANTVYYFDGVYAPPGAALNVYCGIKVPPAFTDTVPDTLYCLIVVAAACAPFNTVLLTVCI